MGIIFVKTGEIGISNTPGDVIRTVLGSCVALVFLAPKTRTVGLAHIALPDSKIADPNNQNILPGQYADTAVPHMIQEFQRKYGVQKPGDLIIKLTGGATVMDQGGTFNIGKRNVLAIRKMLWKNHLAPIAEEVGENYSRKVSIEIETGRVLISSPGKGEWEI